MSLASAWVLTCAAAKTSGGQPAGGSTTAGQTAQGTPQRGGFLNATPTDRPFPLDPQKLSASSQKVVGGVYSRLLRYKVRLDPNPVADHNTKSDLALGLESPDAVTWTARLRPDALFHDIAPVNGRAVDSEDVKATFTRALDPATGNPNRGVLDMIDPANISTPDKQTVVFKLSYPYAPFLNIAGSPAYSPILSREVLTGLDPAKVIIGSGPFVLDSAQPDVAYTYKRNPNSQVLDARVRRAFSLAIDRDAISKSVYNGQSDLVVYIPGYMGNWAVKVSELPQNIQQYYKTVDCCVGSCLPLLNG